MNLMITDLISQSSDGQKVLPEPHITFLLLLSKNVCASPRKKRKKMEMKKKESSLHLSMYLPRHHFH